ncbi:MAG: hypothetical protein KKF48_03465 [Nanoarchaeota archaeon]|nr:hypothetical protein [Nanoarchaeota archaeon]MBU1028078.1 hypothetical protein [Nanoarchaeota archaeon]
MKKEVIVLVLLGILFFSPLVLAKEQSQNEDQIKIYSGFNRFVDNVKLFFSSGDNKVLLALEIKEKEVYSAIENNNNEDEEDTSRNLKNAWKKLQLVQEKVSLNIAEQVQASSSQIKEKINQEENLAEDFEVYILEEEKTELTAEWVVEVNGKEGQTLKREVEIVKGEDNGQNRIMEIETRIGEIDNEIKNWVVKNSVGKDGGRDEGLTWEVKTEVANGDDGLKPEVKIEVAKQIEKREMEIAKGENSVENQITKDNEDVTPAPNVIDNDVAPGPDGIVGVIVPEPREDGPPSDSIDNSVEDSSESSSDGNSGSESNSEDSGGDGGITGEVVKNSNSNNIIKKIFDWMF